MTVFSEAISSILVSRNRAGLSQLWLRTWSWSPRISVDNSDQLFETQPLPNWISQTPFPMFPCYCSYWIKLANQNCHSGFWECCHFLVIMIIRLLVIRKQMLHVSCTLSLYVSFRQCSDRKPKWPTFSFLFSSYATHISVNNKSHRESDICSSDLGHFDIWS